MIWEAPFQSIHHDKNEEWINDQFKPKVSKSMEGAEQAQDLKKSNIKKFKSLPNSIDWSISQESGQVMSSSKQ